MVQKLDRGKRRTKVIKSRNIFQHGDDINRARVKGGKEKKKKRGREPGIKKRMENKKKDEEWEKIRIAWRR